MPTTLQETFFVDPASATGSYLTEPGREGGSVLGHIAESFTASDITLTTNGQILQQSASGTFTFSGDRASDYGPSGSFFGGLSLPDGGGGSDFASQYAQAPPDWAAFLSTSSYHSDTGLFTLSGSFGELDVVPQGQAVSVKVPEPGALPLWALAAAGLLDCGPTGEVHPAGADLACELPTRCECAHAEKVPLILTACPQRRRA